MSRSIGRQECEAVLRPAARPQEARLDKWLFCARFCRTRETAQDVIEGGKVRLNGARVQKPGHAIRPGDVLTVALGGTVQVVTVLELAERRGAAEAAQALYQPLED
jgi:ribosome-associated heat shock protein Hsp15